MKHYERQYELIYSSPDLIKKGLKLEEVYFLDNIPSDIGKYAEMQRKIFADLQTAMFDFIVREIWLRRRFGYKGKFKRTPDGKTITRGLQVDRAYSLFLRNYANVDYKLYFYDWRFLSRLTRYIDIFFPYFELGDPFKKPEDYKFPYKYMNLECLYLVYQMPEKMELLEYGENCKMSFPVFFDYVVNYISCYNEEHGDTYRLKMLHDFRLGNYVSLIFFKDVDKKNITKRNYKKIGIAAKRKKKVK